MGPLATTINAERPEHLGRAARGASLAGDGNR
jgi:hypothetical protein